MTERQRVRVLTGDKVGALKILYPFLPGEQLAFRVASAAARPSPACGMCFGRAEDEVFVAHSDGHVDLYHVPPLLVRRGQADLDPAKPSFLAAVEARDYVELEPREVSPRELERQAPPDPLKPRRDTKGRVGRRELAAKRSTGDVARCVGYLPQKSGGVLFLIMADATVLRFRHSVETLPNGGGKASERDDESCDPQPSTKRLSDLQEPGASSAPPPGPSRIELDIGLTGRPETLSWEVHKLTFESKFKMWVFEGQDAHPEAFHIVSDPDRGQAFCMAGGWMMGCRIYDALTGRLRYVCEWPPRSVPANVLPRFWATSFAHDLKTGSLFIGDMDGFIHCYQPGLWGPNAGRVQKLDHAAAAERIRTLPNRKDVKHRDGISAYHELTTDRDLLNPDKPKKPDRYSAEYAARKAAEKAAQEARKDRGASAALSLSLFPQKKYRLRDCGIPGVEGAWSSASVWRIKRYDIKVCSLAVAEIDEGEASGRGGFQGRALICANGEGRVDLLAAESGAHLRSFKGTFGAAKSIGAIRLPGLCGASGHNAHGEAGTQPETLAAVGTLDKYVRIYTLKERQAVAARYMISDVLALLVSEVRVVEAGPEGEGEGENPSQGELVGSGEERSGNDSENESATPSKSVKEQAEASTGQNECGESGSLEESKGSRGSRGSGSSEELAPEETEGPRDFGKSLSPAPPASLGGSDADSDSINLF